MGTFIIILILVLLVILFIFTRKSENFDYESECKNCEKKSFHQCLNCKDCGVCSDQLGNMYCVKGDEHGPSERKDCYKWFYGNIYPQYYYRYYNKEELDIPNDARFYPFLKTLDERKGTKYFSKDYMNGFYKNFNNTLQPSLYRR